MFLIFNLRRPDVWPVDDIGLQKAVALHYLEGERPSLKALREQGRRFMPWRTVATWYLWRSLDSVVVQY
jgi:DNA-3-methyladenine glycosylase II